MATIEHRFRKLLQADPGRTLVAGRGRVATVQQVDAMADDLAQQPAIASLPPDGLVGLLTPGGAAFLAGLLALRRARQAVLLLDPGTPAAEQEAIARSLGAAGVLAAASAWAESAAHWELSPVPDAPQAATLPGIGVVKLTSGSTGEPRGIATSEDALVADADALNRTMGITSEDRLLASIPLSHSYGLSTLAVTALTQGSTLVLAGGSSPFEPLLAADELEATVFPTVPSFLQALLRLSQPLPEPRRLRLVISAGAPLTPATAGAFRRRFGLAVHVFYGASECGGICYDRSGTAGERGTVGTPVDGVRITLDESGGGEGGSVVVESPAVASGYLPEDGDSLRGGRFRSKDHAAWQGGELLFLGRREDWINVAGKKVNPREVEAVLKALAGIDDALVFGFAIPGREGEAVRALVAGAKVPEYMKVVAHCRAKLASYKVPRSVLPVDEIPRTPRGKLDWPRIRRLTGESVHR
jgi:long-chain acyl-CoA synthetase